MTHLFFYVSGEHETLPYAEIKSILVSEGFQYRSVEVYTQLMSLESNLLSIPSIVKRAAYVKACGTQVFRCKPEEKEIIYHTKREDFNRYLENGQSFSVRIRKAQTQLLRNSGKLESDIGQIILERTKHSKVKLNNPDKTFLVIVTGNLVVFGLVLAQNLPKDFQRTPKRLPFFHPSVMSRKLARCMVNLSRNKFNSLVLDPFCGTGAILVEAGLIGCEVIGSDLNVKMTKGTLRNLQYFKIKKKNLLVADACNLPLEEVDSIVTDPPYGRTSSTFGRKTEILVYEFLSSAVDVVKKNGYICISLPDSVEIRAMCEDLGYIIVEEHHIREHKSLTRKISILSNDSFNEEFSLAKRHDICE